MSRDIVTRHFNAFGSACELLTVNAGQGALERCENRLRDAESRFTRYVADSELACLNASSGRYVPLSPDMFGMLEAVVWAFEESEGLVNAAIRLDHHAVNSGPMPALAQLLVMDHATRSAALAPGYGLDLGTIVRGFLADRCIDELGENGVCNLGGQARLSGGGPGGEGWRMSLCDRSSVSLTQGAVCSDGTLRRRWGHSATQAIIDPGTGLPLRTDVAEVSVVTDYALRGAVYARCALLLGAASGRSFLEARGVVHAIVPVTLASAA